MTFLLIEDGSMSMWIFFGVGRERVELAGDAVVEARADVDHHVAVVHRHVGLVGAVHAQHAQELRSPAGIARPAPSGSGDRKAGHASTNSRSSCDAFGSRR